MLPGDRDLRGPGWFLWWLVISQRWRILLGALLGTLWMLGLVLPPYVLSLAIDDGLQPRRFSSLAGWVLVLLAMGAVNACVAVMRHRTMTKVRMDGAFRTLHAQRAAALAAARRCRARRRPDRRPRRPVRL